MADWDADSAQLEQNLLIVLETIRDNARRRTALSLETARQWHAESLRDLAVPDARYVGGFRGEPGLEKVQVHVGDRFGVAVRDVASALAAFERTIQPVITRLDALILAPGSTPSGFASTRSPTATDAPPVYGLRFASHLKLVTKLRAVGTRVTNVIVNVSERLKICLL